MTAVPLIVRGITAKVRCPVSAVSWTDIFCLGLKALLFLFGFPPLFLFEWSVDRLISCTASFKCKAPDVYENNNPIFLFCISHNERVCLKAVLSIWLCMIVTAQSYAACLYLALFSCVCAVSHSYWRGRSWSHLWYQIFSWRAWTSWQTEQPLSSHTEWCVWACILIREKERKKNGSVGLKLHIEKVWGFVTVQPEWR